MASTKLQIIVDAKDNASGVLGRIGGALGSLGTLAAGVAVTGLAAIAGGLAAVGATGLSFNAQIEQVTARLNAFTKDGAETAKILGLIKEEASKTPFEFQEMANAAANLMSSAKQTNIPLMELVKTAEILAASNPAQGLEGAAFSLKEALSGDFVSIIERFNLPRVRLNELKEQGIPAMEAIGIAMREMGLDSSLVANMAETAAGRWSTLKDNFTNMAGVITQPIFDTFSAGLGSLNAWFSANEGLVMSYAQAIAGNIQLVIDTFSSLASGDIEGAMARSTAILMKMGLTKEQSFAIVDTVRSTIGDITEVINAFMSGGLFGTDTATPGGTAQTGGLLRALGLSDEEVASVQESIRKITIAGGQISEAFGKIFGAGTEAGTEQTNALVQLLEGLATVMEKIAAAGDVAAQIRAIVEATGGIGAGANAIIEGQTGVDLARAGEMRPVAGQFGGTGSTVRNIGALNNESIGSGLSQASGQIGAGDIGASLATLADMIVAAFSSAPPPLVTVNANLDGNQIANSVSVRLGEKAQGLSRIGGPVSLH